MRAAYRQQIWSRLRNRLGNAEHHETIVFWRWARESSLVIPPTLMFHSNSVRVPVMIGHAYCFNLVPIFSQHALLDVRRASVIRRAAHGSEVGTAS